MIFLTGLHCSGKTEAAQVFSLYNFKCFELGETLRKKWCKETPEIAFDEWYRAKEEIFGPRFTDEVLVAEIKKQIKELSGKPTFHQDLVLIGSRSFRGIQHIINNLFLVNNRKNIIIYIEASRENLKERFEEREKKRVTPEEFSLWLERDRMLGIETIIPHANYKIMNNGSKEEFGRIIKKIIFSDLKYWKNAM